MSKFVAALFVLISALSASAKSNQDTVANYHATDKEVVIVIDSSKEGTRKTSQTLRLYQYGYLAFVAKVSTGVKRAGGPHAINLATLRGLFKPKELLPTQKVYSNFSVKNVIKASGKNVMIYGHEDITNLGKQTTQGGIRMSILGSEVVYKAVQNSFDSCLIIIQD